MKTTLSKKNREDLMQRVVVIQRLARDVTATYIDLSGENVEIEDNDLLLTIKLLKDRINEL